MYDLLRYLPSYYENSVIMQQLMASNEEELQRISDKILSALDNMVAGSSTTALGRWEKELGLPSGEGKLDSYRQSVIMAKLRGAGTTTKAMIKNTALAYVNGDVDVAEVFAQYLVKITFTSTKGVPPNFTDFATSIRDILPAHLAIEYIFIYNTHAELSAFTHAHLSAYTHDQLRNGVIS